MTVYQWALERLEAPALMPISLAEAKAWLRVGHSAEDDLITGIIQSATAYLDGADGYLGRCLMSQKWRLIREGVVTGCSLSIPLGGVTSVQSVVMVKEGVENIVPAADYQLIRQGLWHSLRPGLGKRWPDHDQTESAIFVEFTAGETDVSAIDPVIKQALLLLIAHYYQNRSAVTAEKMTVVPMAVKTLLSGHKIPVF